MLCRWVFLEEVMIVPGVFDGLLFMSVDRIHGIFQSISDCFLGASILSSSLIGSNSTTAS
jgi:hypothetical protein